jgi:ferredoxin
VTSAAAPQRAALAARAALPPPAARSLTYPVRPTLLVIGPGEAMASVWPRLPSRVPALAVVSGAMPAAAPPAHIRAISGRVLAVSGWLGQFEASVAGRDGPVALRLGGGDGRFDQVLDLSRPPLVSRPVPPPGYFAPQSEGELDAALRAIAGPRREKPVYVAWQEALCVRGRQGVSGCTRCLTVCPAEAIRDNGDSVQVELFLCQGCGACTTVCPTGALAWAHPPREHTVAVVIAMLDAFRGAGGRSPVLAVHGGWDDPEALDRDLAAAAPWVLPLTVDAPASVGVELWFAALAHGAARVVLAPPSSTPRQVVSALAAQVRLANAILQEAGLGPGRITLVRADTPTEVAARVAALDRPEAPPARPAAARSDSQDGRALLLDMLDRIVPTPRAPVALPPDAPFGSVHVDRGACTVCLACANLCPTGALFAPTGETPRLAFVEARCVQCGICDRGCPEHAVRLEPRLVLDAAARTAPRELARGGAIRCSDCGVAFLSARVLEALLVRLRDHPELATAEGRARLGRCPACRQRTTFFPPQPGE